jgi:hypothetical protein
MKTETRLGIIRAIICRDCPHRCEPFLSGSLDLDNPGTQCGVEWSRQWRSTRVEDWLPLSPDERLSAVLKEQAEKGRAAWLWLHSEAIANRLTPLRLKSEFEPMIPGFGCSCLGDWRAILVKIPFCQDDQFAWTVDVHNAVNAKLEKPILSVADALELGRFHPIC